MSESVKLKLKHPIEFGSETISELTVRPGKLGDIKGVALHPGVAELILIASRLCGQPTGVIERLDPDDAGQVMDMAADFFRRCLSTGGDS